jgi:hypothetical protein
VRIVALLALAAGGYGCTRTAAPAPAVQDTGDLSARCEDALAGKDPVPAKPLPWAFQPDLAIGDENDPLGRVVGAAWHPRQQRLYVLDGMNHRVAVYDAGGEHLYAFGRQGKGPGEFDELGGVHGSRTVYNQLGLLGDGHVVVQDFDLLHVFELAGRFVGRTGTNGARAGPLAIRHVAAVSDSTVLFAETGAMRLDTDDREIRTGVRLLKVFLRNGSIDTFEVATMRNSLARLPPFERIPPRDPYGSAIRRTWDGIASGLLAVAPQSTHGVCFFDRAGERVRAYRLDVPPIAVDRAERNRIQQELRDRFGPTVPMTGGRWDDFYSNWPKIIPPYFDIALSPDSVAWVERARPDRSRVVDLYHAESGYLGSLEPLGARLPLTFSPGCAFMVDEQIPSEVRGSNFFYGLRRWCSAAAASSLDGSGGPPSHQPTGGR